MTSFRVIIKEIVKQTPIGPPLQAASKLIREAANRRRRSIEEIRRRRSIEEIRRRRSIEEIEAEITLHAMYQLQDFLISGATLPFPEADQPIVSVILILHEQAELSFGCLRSLKESSHLPLEITAIDKCSNDLNGKLFEKVEGGVRYIRNTESQNPVCDTNQAAELSRGKYLLLLDSAAELTPGALEASVKSLDTNPSLGAVGGRLILPNGTLQEAGGFIWEDGLCQGYGRGDDPTSGAYMFPRLVDYCSRAFLMTPRSIWHELGGLDELFASTHYGEADYCMRLWQAGHHVRYEPRAAVWHFRFSPFAIQHTANSVGERQSQALRGQARRGLTGSPQERECP